MTLFERILGQRRLALTLVFLLTMSGVVMWMTMVRQEDPRLPDFWGQVVAPYPGAPAETVERMVLEPMDDALAEVAEIKDIKATAFDEMAVVEIELRDDVKDFNHAWDEVRQALEKAQADFPDGAGTPVLDEDLQDPDSVVLAVTGSPDPLVLLKGARTIKDELLALTGVGRVHFVADPREQVTVDLDDSVARRLGLSAPDLVARLGARSLVLPGGSLKVGGKRVRLRPLSEFSSVEEIAETSVLLPTGSSVPLGEVARVRLGPKEPASSRMRFNGEMCVGVAVVPRKSVNLVSFGHEVREKVSALAPRMKPLKIQEVTFQPAKTSARLEDLNRSLLMGILVVAGVLILSMGVRLGLLVASVVPLVALISLALFAWGGGTLHQISIAALVLALGILVDNAIVVSENVQWRLDRGEGPRQAALGAVRELIVPLAGATATTIAAFVPMLISQGPTAAFTRSLPVVLILTLSVSYAFAIFITPILGEMVLVPRVSKGTGGIQSAGARLARFAVRHTGWVLITVALVVAGSLVGAGRVRQQFFPSSDRNEFIVDLKMAEGSHLDGTDAASRRLEKALLGMPEVTAVAGFVGRSAPQFYYNIPHVPFSPHYAQLIVRARTTKEIEAVLGRTRGFARKELPEAEVVARKLEQGPPVEAPVEVRLFGRGLEDLNRAARAVSVSVRDVPGTRDVRHDLGPGAPTIRFRVDDAAAGRYGLTRADLAKALYGRTRGLMIGELRSGDDPIPVLIRSSEGEDLPAEDLESVGVATTRGRLIPLAQVARQETAWSPAAIKHRNGRRVVTVSAQLEEGYTFSDVLPQLQRRLQELRLPPGIDVGFGGDAEGSEEANSALIRSFPIGLLILLGVLLAEFNSFRRLFVILTTIPLAAAGVVPGLLISGQPFGFMSMLGVIALVGIVVNNAIVLIEVAEDRRREGSSLEAALEDAVTRRIRPILLTTATTAAGLLPLALSTSSLWPPLAWAMISGLVGSTLLTLVFVPALYHLLFSGFLRRKRSLEMGGLGPGIGQKAIP